MKQPKQSKPSKQLKLLFFGGVGEIGKNMTAIEYDDTIIVVDAGMSFPDNELMPGIEYVIPDYSYLTENKDKVKALFLTHAHEDHIGATPFFLQDIGCPVYGSAISLAFMDNKFRKRKIKEAERRVTENGSVIEVGPFKVEFIRVTHSVAGAFALSVETPKGVIFYTGDFKIDHTPVDGRRTDLTRIAEIGKRGVLLMLQDSTNVERPGYAMSESAVGKSLDVVFNENRAKRIVVATFASNIHRVQQIINCSVKYGRKVAFCGLGLEQTSDIAKKLGELNYPQEAIISSDKIGEIPHDRICLIATGTQGEEDAALTRMSRHDYKKTDIGAGDTVILSSSAIPGNERPIFRVINDLCKSGAKVIYESFSEVHASGHACREELKLMLALISPSYFIPVHGEYRHLMRHAELAEEMGVFHDNIMIPAIGDVIDVSRGGLKKLAPIKSGVTMLASDDTEANEDNLKVRRHLAEEGLAVAVVTVQKNEDGDKSGSLELFIKGTAIAESVISECKDAVAIKYASDGFRGAELEDEKAAVRKTLSKIFYNKLKRCPIIIPIIIEI